ncbi:MAG TPA: nucleotide exchange factor GrpE [Fimbriiglobus sp.]
MATEEPTPLEHDEAAALREQLSAAEKQVADYKSLVAEFDNARKRLNQDAARERKYAAEPIFKDLLGPIDNLDRTLDAAKKAGDTGPLVQGVAATAAQILEVFKRFGVTVIPAGRGTPFDPNVHQAVTQQPAADVSPGAVVLVLEKGFLLHDRVLRPASVIVASE